MTEDEVKLLNIKKVRKNDTGAYLCRVLNEYGFADLVHYLVVLPGMFYLSFDNIPWYPFDFIVAQRPSVLKNFPTGIRNYISNRLAAELIITIAAIVAILFFAFICFLIYHYRNQKSLRQTLLATRILATRGISNLKSVSERFPFQGKNKKQIDILSNRINSIEVILIRKRKNH